jgi:hypothetical protein
MSTKAGTIQGTQTGVSWMGGWIVAILLTAFVAVTLFAMTSGSGSADPVPANDRTEITQQLGGGGPIPGLTHSVRPAQPVTIGDYVCHQCR